ncbi:MAG: hypothetical protein QM733_22835 [Ilumatobacteraceae bacterium]
MLGADAYLCELLGEWPIEVTATVVRIANEKRNPPRTVDEQLVMLERAGVPEFAQGVRQQLASPGEARGPVKVDAIESDKGSGA